MISKLRTLTLCFLVLCGALEKSSAFSVREGQRETFTRFVLESDKGGEFISRRVIENLRVELILKGGVCQDIKKHLSIRSKIIQSWSVKDLPVDHCKVTCTLYKKGKLKRGFLLKKNSKYPARFVLDIMPLEPLAMALTPPMVKPVVNSKIESFIPNIEVWQKSPPHKPPYKLDTHLEKDGSFQPQLFEKPLRPTIVIDPGHGGHDPGSVSCRGHFEKHVTLNAAKNILTELKKTGRYHVILTRGKDEFVPKRKRFAKAREAKADFFISVHADSHPLKNLRGLTIYTLSAKASDTEAARLAQRENKSEFLEDLQFSDHTTPDVSNVLINIAQRGSKNTALQLAEKLHECFRQKKVGKLMTLRSADLAVLKAPDTPSILIELGYLSNEKDEKLVRSSQYQKALAKSLLQALDQFFDKC